MNQEIVTQTQVLLELSKKFIEAVNSASDCLEAPSREVEALFNEGCNLASKISEFALNSSFEFLEGLKIDD